MDIAPECSVCGQQAEDLYPISLRRPGSDELWTPDEPVCLGCIALWRGDGWTCEIIDPAAEAQAA